MPVSVFVGRTDDGHAYARAHAWCSACAVEGEPQVGVPSDGQRLQALATIAADLDASGLCSRCRAAHAGVVL